MRRRSNGKKIAVAVLCGLMVTGIVAGIHLLTMQIDKAVMMNLLVGDFIAGLTTIIVCLAIQLRQEEIHYAAAMDRAAIISELNHHVRNAVFPLCLTLQKTGDQTAIDIAQDSVERINVALKEATAGALSGRSVYGPDSTKTAA